MQLQLQRQEGAFKVSLRGFGLVTAMPTFIRKMSRQRYEGAHFFSASPNFRIN